MEMIMKVFGYGIIGASMAAAGAVIYFGALPDCTQKGAVNAMQQAVAAKMKSPSTARFPESFKVEKKLDCVYDISGPVDSQNSFGAIVRSSYTGIVVGKEYKVMPLIY